MLGLASLGQALMKPGAKLLRADLAMCTPAAGDNDARCGHARKPCETDPFPGHPHGA